MANKKKKKTTKKKTILNNRILWALMIILAIVFFFIFAQLEMFPFKWKFYLLLGLIIVVLVTGLLSIQFWKSKFVKLIDVVLIVSLTLASVLIPHYEDKVSSLFNSISGDKVKISLYVMNSDVRSDNLDDYANAIFISSIQNDTTNQNYALSELNSYFGSDVTYIDRVNVIESAAALYEGTGDVMILTETMENMITETEGYENFETETKVIYSFYRQLDTSTIETTDTTLTTEPFTIFFGGNDEEGDLYLEGRTDVDMIVTVNPNTHQISIISLPRDSYVPNLAYGSNYSDKLTHLGLMGIQNTMDGLNSYLGLDDVINNYFLVNFTTFRVIIDAVGGVDVENDVEFTAINDMYYPAGTVHLEGEYALMYVRERYAFDNLGDFERNYHQQLVMKALIQKLTSVELISSFDTLLTNLQGTFLTNLSSDSIYALCKKQLNENISWNIVNYHVEGEVGYEYCASVSGTQLSVVYPYDNQIDFVSGVIQSVIRGDIVTQEELPEGEFYSNTTSDSDWSSEDSSDSYDFNYNYAEYDPYSGNDENEYGGPGNEGPGGGPGGYGGN